MVTVGKVSIVVLMAVAAVVALLLSNALQAFYILLQIGAGTGLLFLLRWFWWRINAASEIAAMTISFIVAIYFEFIHTRLGFTALVDWQKLIIGVGITTVGWIVVTFITKPTDQKTLFQFYQKIQPGGPGWQRVLDVAEKAGVDVSSLKGERWDMPYNLLAVSTGAISIYSVLFSIGFFLYANLIPAIITLSTAMTSSFFLIKLWNRLNIK